VTKTYHNVIDNPAERKLKMGVDDRLGMTGAMPPNARNELTHRDYHIFYIENMRNII
jgi:hypothetical protein